MSSWGFCVRCGETTHPCKFIKITQSKFNDCPPPWIIQQLHDFHDFSTREYFFFSTDRIRSFSKSFSKSAKAFTLSGAMCHRRLCHHAWHVRWALPLSCPEFSVGIQIIQNNLRLTPEATLFVAAYSVEQVKYRIFLFLRSPEVCIPMLSVWHPLFWIYTELYQFFQKQSRARFIKIFGNSAAL